MIKLLIIASLFLLSSGSGLPSKCGRPVSHSPGSNWRVHNGQDAAAGEFPWQILLTQKPDAKVEYRETNFCGGTIINERWVLTAAHCVTDPFNGTAFEAKIFLVRLGVHNLSLHESHEFDFSVEKNIPHHAWNNQLILNDIALLKLNASLDFVGKHAHLVPVCLANNSTSHSGKCVVTGFGMFDNAHIHPPNGILQKLDVNFVTDDDCKKKLNGMFDHDTQVCVAGVADKSGLCSGDSGGPLQCVSSDGVWHQLGTLSYGTGCEVKGAINGYTKVSHYIDWIEHIIAAE